MDLCTRFQLRFIVIADRFQCELQAAGSAPTKREAKALSKIDRTVDELKDRYFSIAKEVLLARGQL